MSDLPKKRPSIALRGGKTNVSNKRPATSTPFSITPTPPSVTVTLPSVTQTPLLSSHSPPALHSTSPIADESSHHVVEETLVGAFEDPVSPPTSRKILVPAGNKEYVPSNDGTNAFTHVLKSRLNEAYHTWKEVPVPIKDSWFEDWKKFVTYDPEHEGHMYKAFLHKGGVRMKCLYYDIRTAERKPKWMLDNVYTGLCAYWATDRFKGLSNRNKTNRASSAGLPVYAGGSQSVTYIMNKEATTKTKMGVDDIYRDNFIKKAGRDKPIEELPEGKTKDDLVWFEQLKDEQKRRLLEDPLYPLKIDDELWKELQVGRNSKGRLLGLNHKRKTSVVTELAISTSRFATQESEIKELKEIVTTMSTNQKQMLTNQKQMLTNQKQMMQSMMQMMQMIQQEGVQGGKGKGKVVETNEHHEECEND